MTPLRHRIRVAHDGETTGQPTVLAIESEVRRGLTSWFERRTDIVISWNGAGISIEVVPDEDGRKPNVVFET